MNDPANVTASILTGGHVLVEWDLNDEEVWNGADIAIHPALITSSFADYLVHDDLPNESDLPRRDHATGGGDVWNPPLDVKNHYRHTAALTDGDWRASVRFTNRSGGTLNSASDWVTSNTVTISDTPDIFGTFVTTEAGNLDPDNQPPPLKSRVLCWRLIGGTLADSQTAIDQAGINFGTTGQNFGGSGGDWATFIENELDPIIAKSSKIAFMLSRPFGMRIVAENTASDTNNDPFAIGRSAASAGWRSGAMISPLEAVEKEIDDVILGDFVASLNGLSGQDTPIVLHYGAALQNQTHDDDAIDGSQLLGSVLAVRAHLALDAHLGVLLADDRTGDPTITKRVVDRLAALDQRCILEGRLLTANSAQWFTATTPTVDALIEFDNFVVGTDEGVDLESPLSGGALVDDPDADYLQPSDHLDRRFFIIIDGTADYVAAGEDNPAKAERAKDLALACMAFGENIYVAIAQSLLDTMDQDDIDELIAASGAPDADLTLSEDFEIATATLEEDFVIAPSTVADDFEMAPASISDDFEV